MRLLLQKLCVASGVLKDADAIPHVFNKELMVAENSELLEVFLFSFLVVTVLENS